jgi:hypothetical protein
MPASITELKSALRIDRLSLDREIEVQPTLFLQAAELAAIARSKLDHMKSELDVLEAELDKELRLSPEIRSTEKAISMELQRHPQRVAAMEAYLGQKYKMEVREQLRDAYRQRGYMLRDLVALHISGYWSDQHSSGDTLNRAKEIRAEYNRERMTERRKSREE